MVAKNPAGTKPVKVASVALPSTAPKPIQAVLDKKAAPAVPFVAAPAAAAKPAAAVSPAANKKPAPKPVRPTPAQVTPVQVAPVQVTPVQVAPVKPEIVTPTAPIDRETTAAPIKEDIMETINTAAITNAGTDFAEKAKTMFADAGSKSKAAMGDMNDFAKGNIEALVESSKIAAKGAETLGQDAAEFARKQFESATAVLKSMSTVKSPTDFFKLQSDYMRTSFDTMVAHSSQSTEKMLKLAGEVAQPIQNRVSVAVEKVKVAA